MVQFEPAWALKFMGYPESEEVSQQIERQFLCQLTRFEIIIALAMRLTRYFCYLETLIFKK